MSDTPNIYISWLRFLDWAQSFRNCRLKAIRAFLKHGPGWRNCVRGGRRFVRVKFDHAHGWRHYVTPGWEQNCWNCKDYSIITGGMMPTIISQWHREADSMHSRGLESHIRPKPTAATARCPNCHSWPGDPE